MVDDEAVEGLEFLFGERHGFVAEGEVGEVAGEDGDLVSVMGLEVAEGLLAAGDEDEEDAARFAELKATGGLLKPEQPGHVMAKLVLDAPKDLSGKFLSWNAEELKAFQE